MCRNQSIYAVECTLLLIINVFLTILISAVISIMNSPAATYFLVVISPESKLFELQDNFERTTLVLAPGPDRSCIGALERESKSLTK